jgi:hypothetical protein
MDTLAIARIGIESQRDIGFGKCHHFDSIRKPISFDTLSGPRRIPITIPVSYTVTALTRQVLRG